MIVDSSVWCAIVFNEPERDDLIQTLLDSEQPLIPTPTLLETNMVVRARKSATAAELETILLQSGAQSIAFTERHLQAAIHAFSVYGKGRGSGAGLNFGDCIVYGVAKAEGLPLLYKGDDFTKTDLKSN